MAWPSTYQLHVLYYYPKSSWTPLFCVFKIRSIPLHLNGSSFEKDNQKTFLTDKSLYKAAVSIFFPQMFAVSVIK